jgi:hypothetical protein
LGANSPDAECLELMDSFRTLPLLTGQLSSNWTTFL